MSPFCPTSVSLPLKRDRLGDEFVETYAGPDEGVQTIRADEWMPFIRTMPHSEFPSASACLCEVSGYLWGRMGGAAER